MKKTLFITSTLLILTIISVAIWIKPKLHTPDMANQLPELPPQVIDIRYYGTSTLLFDDGTTQLMIDGFFSRPTMMQLLYGDFSPNLKQLKHVVQQEQLTRLAAIIPVHSHHDHAMDTAPLAELTGAQVLGSNSTANLARGWGLPEAQITIAESQPYHAFGDFTIQLIPTRHVPMPSFLTSRIGMGEPIAKPVTQPASLGDYKEGKSYSVVIRHPKGNYLVQGSAGFIPNALSGLNIDIAFLGIAGLSNQSREYQNAYFQEMIINTNAKTVVPIHWESFMKPASTKGLPVLVDNLEDTMEMLKVYSESVFVVKPKPVGKLLN